MPNGMRESWRVALVLLLLVLGGREVRADQPPPAALDPDWTAMIAQLRESLMRTPEHAETRRQLAIAYNNYGITLANRNQFKDAETQLQEAIKLDPADAQFTQNLAKVHLREADAFYEAHQMTDARAAITKVLALNPEEASAYILLGELEYNNQRLKEAKAAWTKALALDANRQDVREKLDRLNQELPVESSFDRLSQASFDIRYTEELERAAGFDVRDALLAARRTVGGDFQYWPRNKLVVLVYRAEQFRKLRQDTPDWLAGQYDGKIRIPLPGNGLDRASVTRTLVHEYTHAVIHDLTNGHVPTWLNEGLAEYEAWKGQQPTWKELREAAAGETLLPWDHLTDRFGMSLSSEEVALAYQQSHSIVRYLVERYGFWRVRRLLKAFAADTPLDTALSTEFHMKPARLQAEWRKWLSDLLAGPSS